MEQTFDYIVVGAGSAGCVLAARLSELPSTRVLLLEAGPPDDDIFVHIPKGFGRLVQRPERAWHLATQSHDDIPAEIWKRGRTMGGSSAVNGMMYFRGQPQDYDQWESAGAKGWGWQHMRAVFEHMEDHELGHGEGHAAGGPLRLSVHPDRNPASLAFIEAGRQMGLPVRHGMSQPEYEGVGFVTRSIAQGRRVSSATAFLNQRVRKRPNLCIKSDALVTRVLFEGRRAMGVTAYHQGKLRSFRAAREVCLSAGALMSPKILMASGIGPADHLRSLDIDVIVDSPGVGRHLLEHRLLMMQYRLRRPVSQNQQFAGWRLARNALYYALSRKGVLASGSHDVAAFVKTRPELDRPDVEILMAPYSHGMNKGRIGFEDLPGLHIFGYPLRSKSEGSIKLSSPDPMAPPVIRANYLSDPYDRQVSLDMFRFMRRMMSQSSMADLIEAETTPGPLLQDDEAIIAAFRTRGQPGLHACGSCKMGQDTLAVVDATLRVRGVGGLRVADGSIMPTMVSANPNGPVMAIGWRAADLIGSGA